MPYGKAVALIFWCLVTRTATPTSLEKCWSGVFGYFCKCARKQITAFRSLNRHREWRSGSVSIDCARKCRQRVPLRKSVRITKICTLGFGFLCCCEPQFLVIKAYKINIGSQLFLQLNNSGIFISNWKEQNVFFCKVNQSTVLRRCPGRFTMSCQCIR